jgi:hypothetical protein
MSVQYSYISEDNATSSLQDALQESRRVALLQNERVSVHTGHETQSDCSPYRLCDLPLVLWAQASVLGVLYPPRLGHVFGHHCEVLPRVSLVLARLYPTSYLVFVDWVDTKHINSVALRLLPPNLPLLLLCARQIPGRVYVSRLPSAVYLALELASPLGLDHLARLCWAVEASFAGQARRKRARRRTSSTAAGRRTTGCGAAAEDGEEGLVWDSFSMGLGGGAEALEAHPASAGPRRSIADMCATLRRPV